MKQKTPETVAAFLSGTVLAIGGAAVAGNIVGMHEATDDVNAAVKAEDYPAAARFQRQAELEETTAKDTMVVTGLATGLIAVAGASVVLYLRDQQHNAQQHTRTVTYGAV